MSNSESEDESSGTRAHLLSLPPEIRTIIYSYIFGDNMIETTHQVATHGKVSEKLVLPSNASITLACRLTHNESIDAFWRQAHLNLVRCPPFGEFALCRRALPQQWNAVRSIFLVLGTAGDEASPYHKPLVRFLDSCPETCRTFLVATVRAGDQWRVARLMPFDPLVRFYSVWKDLRDVSQSKAQERCGLVIVPTGFHLLVDQIRYWLRGWRENSGIVDRMSVEPSEPLVKSAVKAVGGMSEGAITFKVSRIIEDDAAET